MFRPKYGFNTPTDAWLRGPLQPLLDILRQPRTANRGLFRPEVLAKLQLDGDWELMWTAATLEQLLRCYLEGEDPLDG
jgi:hypothetical protein